MHEGGDDGGVDLGLEVVVVPNGPIAQRVKVSLVPGEADEVAAPRQCVDRFGRPAEHHAEVLVHGWQYGADLPGLALAVIEGLAQKIAGLAVVEVLQQRVQCVL